ncbi:hypothetical protein A2U01_0112928 [Trifolium medium]|uniref:Uncharacterized protein n=1 Tax=Trifolium medium TaxID=97028 RepID=A0A392VTA7_9FABA|nr:hypothetical protein [Trifolium medium]
MFVFEVLRVSPLEPETELCLFVFARLVRLVCSLSDGLFFVFFKLSFEYSPSEVVSPCLALTLGAL